MYINVIASGSKGNATVITDGKTSLLLDAGVGIQSIREAVNFNTAGIDAFPLPEDEDEKKSMELAEVAAKTKSIKTYIKNNGMPVDEDAEEEIKQIVAEKRMLEDMYEPEQIGTE